MNIYKLAATNVRRNVRNYSLYFFSIVFNVMIYYMFVSARFNEQIMAFTAGDEKITAMFHFASVLIALFSALFIWYSSSFFLQKRKQELGLYALLGVRRRTIGQLMFGENVIMGLLALLIGMGLGTLFSKLLLMLLLKVMGIHQPIAFAISADAVLSTFFVFGLLFLVVSAFSSNVIYRAKLIELFAARKMGQPPVKPSWIGALISLVILAGGYAAGLLWEQQETFVQRMTITLIFTVWGTFLFFRYGLGFFMNQLRKNRTIYFHRMNLIDISQFIYRIRSNARMLSTITVLTAVTLTSVGITYAVNYQVQTNIRTMYPFSFSYASDNLSIDRQVEQAIEQYPQHQLLESVEASFIPVETDASEIQKEMYLMSIRDYRQVIAVKGEKEAISFTDSDQAVLLYYGSKSYRDMIGKSMTIEANDRTESITVIDWKPISAMGASQFEYVLVASDKLYDQLYSEEQAKRAKGYIVENQLDSRLLTKDIIRIVPMEANLRAIMDDSGVLIWTAILNFIGVLLGLVFLLSTGSMIFFKQLTEAENDRARYDILQKMGVTSKQIKKSISRQMLLLFGAPLLLGSCHYLVAMSILWRIINFGNIVIPTLVTLLGYAGIYLFYYALTVNAYFRLVMRKS
ncbi:hypothetical protein BEP19_09115 [Ammoniphilus oxalaticus]|uniref:ABC3 transporter permease C-terminal domain-containing protein n=1 Tax=Ammoniphilus oxalaticus TaxID=66863 RepID=A0A419SKN0_9BACL|nr:ABC transporter permease [Ammoniphilus oxalaticus]RKD24532.1 hypothetical protein BEP19_09115 [Ammoniphilus oxalaticus]